MEKFIFRVVVTIMEWTSKKISQHKTLRRVLLGMLVPVLLISTTYSSVFFMKGEVWWAALYGGIMAASGWCFLKVIKCES